MNLQRLLDGRDVPLITAYLFHTGPDEDAAQLDANDNRCFVGNVVLGIGFTFDDSDSSGQANTIAEMNELIVKDPRNSQLIFPYINGQEVNSSVSPEPSRYVINFGDMAFGEARKWPDLLEIAERKVKPLRYGGQSTVNPERWWMFARPASDLYSTIVGLHRILVRSLTSTNFSTFTFLPNGIVYDQTLIVFAFETADALSILASRIHESWGLFQGGSMKDDPRYNVDDCFKTFPFPRVALGNDKLTRIGNSYYQHRCATQRSLGEGLTKTYNRFHVPYERSPEIERLRELHAEMDRAVLRAYGWDDLAEAATCEFLLDYEEKEDEGTGKKSKKKKPWRLRWPDEFRDEVLARLLELNEERHKEELLVAKQSAKAAKEGTKPKQPGKRELEPNLFDLDEASSVNQLIESERMTLAIISAWGEGTMVDRLLFGEAAVLWLNNQHRQYRCGESSSPQKRFKPAPDVTQLIGNAIRRGWITPVFRGEIEFVKLIARPSPLRELTNDEELKRQQIVQVVAEELRRDEPRVQKGEDYVRATALFARS